MAEASNIEQTMYYSFRFGKTNKVVHLDQQQLQHFPYLVALVERSQDFISNKNQNDEYVLDSNIRYRWFLPIICSVTQEQPSLLFSKLPLTCNVLGSLQLYDYLCIKPLPLPRFKDDKLVRTHPTAADENEKYVKFVRANVGETRNLAVQFMMAISRDEYDLNDLETKDEVFSLIMSIFSNSKVFNIKFRSHTLKIVMNYCYASFSEEQKKEIPTVKRIKQMKTTEFCVNNNEALPDDFQNKFAWKLVEISKEEYDAIHATPDSDFYFSFDDWSQSDDMVCSGYPYDLDYDEWDMTETCCTFYENHPFLNSRNPFRHHIGFNCYTGTRCMF
ncbi:unnamed protein product [Adineta ricciae]|uniref:Uncharacterized protein n=1 Tax=Adineta ricciae TaxID=249248 RepID=A0A815GIF4_ADIRI|nr:unnamed protein product [Adineta ricciae]CAF1338849.1 unnamed protein product [Adineta ricciae]